MTKADFALIQSELDLELPDFYWEFVHDYPKALHAPGCHAWQVELLDLAHRIITLNQQIRSFQTIDWEEEYFIIGESGCGDYYAIDIDDNESPVYFWNHDIGDFDDREEIDSLDHFAEHIIQMYEYLRQMKRPWWKFW
ncbi:MAG: SMI1/KNR4 family protein [Planctomycetes bacterium]|nr:SMI1/KNR4 family protein [Planctomycetota bacterium]